MNLSPGRLMASVQTLQRNRRRLPTLAPMIAARYQRRGRIRAARLLLIAAAFVGLFAMHGLGDHGTTHRDMAAPMPPPASTAGLSSSDHSTPISGTPALAIHANEAQVEKKPGMDDTAMVGLCFAVLAGAGLALTWLRSSTPMAAIRRWPYRSVPNLSATAQRDRDPPCQFELSIQRC